MTMVNTASAWRAWTFCLACVGVPLLLREIPYGTYAGPVALGFLPLPPQHAHLGILATGLGLWLTHDSRFLVMPHPTRSQRVYTAFAVAIVTLLAWWVTHPSAALLAQWRQAAAWQGVLLSMAVYLLLLLPGMLCFGLLYPWNAIRLCLRPLAASAFLGAGFGITGIVSTVWHGPLSAPALNLAGWLLQRIDPGATTVDASAFLIGFRGFVARVGPQCAALDGVLLFGLLAYACWRFRSGARPLRALSIGLAYAALLFFFNGVRIAGIMLVGSYNRMVGLELFHGMAGMLLVIAMVWIFDRTALRTRSSAPLAA